jgi:hypothetical protein
VVLVTFSDLQKSLFHSQMGSGSGVGKSLRVGSGVGSGLGAKNLLEGTSGIHHFLGVISGVDFLSLNILPNLQIDIPCNIIPHE